MHVRVTRGSFDPARYDELMKIMDDLATAVKGVPGFRAYQGGLDRDAGTLVAISTWDGADAANFPRETLGSVYPRILDLGVQLDPPEIFEVALSI